MKEREREREREREKDERNEREDFSSQVSLRVYLCGYVWWL